MHHLLTDVVLEFLAALLAGRLVQLVISLVIYTLVFFGELSSRWFVGHIKCHIDIGV